MTKADWFLQKQSKYFQLLMNWTNCFWSPCFWRICFLYLGFQSSSLKTQNPWKKHRTPKQPRFSIEVNISVVCVPQLHKTNFSYLGGLAMSPYYKYCWGRRGGLCITDTADGYLQIRVDGWTINLGEPSCYSKRFSFCISVSSQGWADFE